MIWIKNHGITGESDNLRIPLKDAGLSVTPHHDEGQTTPIVELRGWTGIKLDTGLPDQALENALLDFDEKVIFAYKQDADHADYDDKAEELDAYYDGTHPDLDDTS